MQMKETSRQIRETKKLTRPFTFAIAHQDVTRDVR